MVKRIIYGIFLGIFFQSIGLYAQSLRLQAGFMGGASRFQADPPYYDLHWKPAFQANLCVEAWFSKQMGISLGILTTQRAGQSLVIDSLSQKKVIQKANLQGIGIPLELLFYVPIQKKTGLQFRGGITGQYIFRQKNQLSTWVHEEKFKDMFWFFLISAGIEHQLQDKLSLYAGLQYQQQAHDAISGSFSGKFYYPGILLQISYFLYQ